METTTGKLLPALQQTTEMLVGEFDRITNDRKKVTDQLSDFISRKRKAKEKIQLNFICTHNSRRSHIAQLWAQVAAYYYGIDHVETFSGGTEESAFNPRAVQAMKKAGFDISVSKDGNNPIYQVRFASDASPLTIFSKKYDDPFNPKTDFAAVMTCSHADENCPVVTGASTRIALTYNDPKDFDGTPQEAAKYSERVNDIGREILYAFSSVK